MFPNFTSLAQREQKRQELLSKAERRKSQSAQKRAMYEMADWVSDQGKTISLATKKTSLEVQTDASYLRDKVESPFLNQPQTKTTNIGVNPDVSDSGVDAMDDEVGSELDIEGFMYEMESSLNMIRIVRQSSSIDLDKLNALTEPLKRRLSVAKGLLLKELNGLESNDKAKIKAIIGSIELMEQELDVDPDVSATIESIKRKLSIGEQNPLKFARQPDIEMKINESSMDKDWRSVVHFMIKFAMRTYEYEDRYKLHFVSKLEGVKTDFYLWESTDGEMGPFTIANKTYQHQVKDEIDWKQTAFYLNSIGLPFPPEMKTLTGNKDRFKSRYHSDPKIKPEGYTDKKEGSDSYSIDTSKEPLTYKDKEPLSLSDAESKHIIEQYCLILLSRDQPLLTPISIVREPGIDKKYVINLGDKSNPMIIQKRIKKNKDGKAGYSNAGKEVTKASMMTIVWSSTFNYMLNELLETRRLSRDAVKVSKDELELATDVELAKANLKYDIDQNTLIETHVDILLDAAFQHNVSIWRPNADPYYELFESVKEAQKLYDKQLRYYEQSPSVAMAAALDAASSALVATKARADQVTRMRESSEARSIDPRIKQVRRASKTEPLVGRGLRGAGSYQNVVRRGKTYNLNDIQGSQLASSYIYKKIGSKYIRIPDLDNKVLNVVFPSRKKLGPKREISSSLQSMLKTLIYDAKIDQASYDQLDHDDQVLFREILSATHIQHSFKETMSDPLESLKAEYEKLKGEIELGNDNPSIIKQLKVITVDCYRNKLISDKEFKEMIVRL